VYNAIRQQYADVHMLHTHAFVTLISSQCVTLYVPRIFRIRMPVHCYERVLPDAHGAYKLHVHNKHSYWHSTMPAWLDRKHTVFYCCYCSS
jgi:hypothetical protein